MTYKEIRMKNRICKLLILAACMTNGTALFAGDMGTITHSSSYIPFISAEGLYSWPKVQGIVITLPAPEQNLGTSDVINRGWGGRVGVGLMHPQSERFAYSGEVGWGYYGQTLMPVTFTSPLSATAIAAGIGNTTGSLERWGFDALIGLYYTQPKYDVYAKAGALFQNLRVSLADIALNTSGGAISTNTTVPAVMPEIKLGAAYHITDKLAANVSWMYVYGGEFNLILPYVDSNGTPLIGSMSTVFKNPSMNLVMFGLEYRFA